MCPNRNKSQEKPEDAQAPASGISSYTNLSVIKSKPFDGVSPVHISASIGHYPIKAFLDTGSNVNLISSDFARSIKMYVDRSRASRWSSHITWSRNFQADNQRNHSKIEARVLKHFEWTLLLSLPTQPEFDITIKTRQRQAMTESEPFSYHVLGVEPVSSAQPLTPIVDGAVNDRTAKGHLSPPDRIEKVLKPSIPQLLNDYKDLITKISKDQARIEDEYQQNFLTGNVPVLRSAYRQSFQAAEDTARKVKERTAQGLIRQSPSAYDSPSTLADHKDGSRRFVNDYRPVESKTKPTCQPSKSSTSDSNRRHNGNNPRPDQSLPTNSLKVTDVRSPTQSREGHRTNQYQRQASRFKRHATGSHRTTVPYYIRDQIHRPGEGGDPASQSPMTAPS